MKKIFILFLALLFSGVVRSYAVYFDIGVSEIPIYIVGVDAADKGFVSFFNVANLRASLNFSDDFAIRFRLTDTYLGLTNSLHPTTGTNKLYVDRLYLKYTSDQFGITLGRDVYSEFGGIVLGNLSDGLFLKSRLASFEQRAYLMYSGLVPQDVNDFNVTSEDQANGSERLQTGIILEKHGVLIRSLSLGYLYSADMSTNTNAGTYNPSFLSLNATGKFGSIVQYGLNLVYGLGQYSTNVSISALAFDVQLQLQFSPQLAVITRVAYAGGDDTNTAPSENYNALGVYQTGQILVPDFSNLLLFHLGVAGNLLQEKLQLGLNLFYMTRPSVGDSVGGFYTGSGSQVGQELSASASWKLDPNITVLASGGLFWKGDAFLATALSPLYKVIAGVQFRL